MPQKMYGALHCFFLFIKYMCDRIVRLKYVVVCSYLFNIYSLESFLVRYVWSNIVTQESSLTIKNHLLG